MARDNFSDLLAFLAVARERSFTKAAAQLGVSQSALSHTIRGLETRLGVRLLTRTTRSVSTTEAGERLMHVAAPRFDEIETELNALSELRDKPVGLIRITATDHPVNAILWPRLKPLLADYPGLKIEMSIDYNLSDIVAQRYDIGVRFGDQVANDMIAVRISPDVRMMIAGSPEYFARNPVPKCPQDLLDHACINLRLPTRGSLYAWELKKGKHDVLVRVDGQLIFNSTPQMVAAALDGFGLTYLPEDELMPHVREGRLKCVLKEWGTTFPGYHAYYPSRRQSSRALSLVIDALRHRA